MTRKAIETTDDDIMAKIVRRRRIREAANTSNILKQSLEKKNQRKLGGRWRKKKKTSNKSTNRLLTASRTSEHFVEATKMFRERFGSMSGMRYLEHLAGVEDASTLMFRTDITTIKYQSIDESEAFIKNWMRFQNRLLTASRSLKNQCLTSNQL